MRTALSGIAHDARHRRSLAACRRLSESGEWRAAKCVFVYIATPRELDTTSLIEGAWRCGRRVLVPRVDSDRVGEMSAVAIGSWSDCLPGFRGILEPIGGDPESVDVVDLVVVPGLAFDEAGHRLGHGGGYYDRFLARPDLRAVTCGVGFEEQVVGGVPIERHDRSLDLLVTDEAVRRFSSSD